MTRSNARAAFHPQELRAEKIARLKVPEPKRLRQEIARLKKELQDKDWAAAKTNEGIKILYKELEKKTRKLENTIAQLIQSEARFRLALKSSPITVLNQDKNPSRGLFLGFFREIETINIHVFGILYYFI